MRLQSANALDCQNQVLSLSHPFFTKESQKAVYKAFYLYLLPSGEMFKCGCRTLQDMSDERFREHQRAVDSGDMNALPSLITEAVRTSTPIYKYAGRILYNLNDNVVRALEQGGLIDVQYYGGDHFRDIAPRVARADKAIASLDRKSTRLNSSHSQISY